MKYIFTKTKIFNNDVIIIIILNNFCFKFLHF